MKSPLLKLDETIPETIAGRILAPVPFSFVEWRIKEERASVTPGVQQKRTYTPEG